MGRVSGEVPGRVGLGSAPKPNLEQQVFRSNPSNLKVRAFFMAYFITIAMLLRYIAVAELWLYRCRMAMHISGA